MADTALTVLDGDGNPQDLFVAESAGDTLTPYHLEDTTQRAALIAALGLLGSQTTAAAILAKISADPASQTTLAAILAKLPAAPATQATLAAILTALSDGTQKTISANPATVYAGQQAVTASALALPSQALVNGLVVTSSPINTAVVFVGATGVNTANDGSGTGYPLSPGQSISFGVTNANAIFVRAVATGSFVSFAGN